MHQLVSEERGRTYKRPSRRYGFPEKGNKFLRKAKVAAIVDTSGSMSSDFLSYIGGHLNQMALIMEVDVIMCDTDIQGDVIKKYRPSAQLDFPGRGGTRLEPAFEYAKENRYKGVICFTDGGLYTNGLGEFELPALWVIVDNENFVAPFGRTCHVNWINKGK
jgi:predicted metal-dependent peptidase